jgi:hypothetical protein
MIEDFTQIYTSKGRRVKFWFGETIELLLVLCAYHVSKWPEPCTDSEPATDGVFKMSGLPQWPRTEFISEVLYPRNPFRTRIFLRIADTYGFWGAITAILMAAFPQWFNGGNPLRNLRIAYDNYRSEKRRYDPLAVVFDL